MNAMSGGGRALLAAPVLLTGMILLSACGSPAAPEIEMSEQIKNRLAKIPEDRQQRFLEVRQAQEQALQDTAALVAAPQGADIGELEDSLRLLNRVMLEAGGVMASLRSLDVRTKLLIEDLRAGNRKIEDAYSKLVQHHPNPTPDQLAPHPDA